MRVTLDGRAPSLADGAWAAPTAVLVGDVALGEGASVWYGAVLRSEYEPIRVGARSNVQDCAVVHVDPGFPATLGDGVTVGHGAVLHGCTVEDDVLVGMGATVLNGARIGTGSMVAAGALVLAGAEVPPGSLVAGVPGKVRRELTDEERELVRANAEIYLDLARRHAGATGG
ncbi:MAG: gamma carbonic anhydrase family protein [Actinomycetota bacterium]|jgi:carbonic anhydrase/acetyltransferase-like protein (isoleucine patch superfamily)|nr:gamma carbonic anhydrase family protein [Actinomycetota bacterium]